MASTGFTPSLHAAVSSLGAAANASVDSKIPLPDSVRYAGQILRPAHDVLQAVSSLVDPSNITQTEECIRFLEACNVKASLCVEIYRDTTNYSGGQQREPYTIAVRSRGDGNNIEILIEGILGDLRGLTNDPAIRTAMEAHIRSLRSLGLLDEATERLSRILFVSERDAQSRILFSNYGSGIQYNAANGGQNNNNTGNGNFFNGTTFSGPVNFGRNE
ncbi:hypothetical protein BJX63DRAFT_199223 [Aspergillus granulosus]|uniref:Uncharacterized protein n=1 Tax=Aspergillus granulosus TaxID=176169 RepID=A0ABR4HGB9_9EURO